MDTPAADQAAIIRRLGLPIDHLAGHPQAGRVGLPFEEGRVKITRSS